ncbi:MAG TPA: hypothetical protein VGN72_05195 [Tepidisphaeraceae bacterium]|jgi:hypothetical protein|nr:hypothetical protein [Tepidisphaeraceae bacterium]
MQTVRFAILHHTGVVEPHYDILIEATPGSAALRTWRSTAWPLVKPTDLVPLPDHRSAYLTHEGPVSGNRGHVTRVAGGECVVTMSDESQLLVRLPDGSAINLIQIEPTHWKGLPLPATPSASARS